MTLRIEITVPEALVADGTGTNYLGRAMQTLGYMRTQMHGSVVLVDADAKQAAIAIAEKQLAKLTTDIEGQQAASDEGLDDKEAIAAGLEWERQNPGKTEVTIDGAPKRERGKPGEGRKRRTNAEIAEDEAAELADAAAKEPADLKAERAEDRDETTQISTGEERVGPEDDAETQALDAADEQAEAAANAPDDKPASLDDIRNALGDYVKLFGMAAAQEDGPKVISLVCGDGVTQISKIPDDKVDKALAGVKEMIAKNPFKRTPV